MAHNTDNGNARSPIERALDSASAAAKADPRTIPYPSVLWVTAAADQELQAETAVHRAVLRQQKQATFLDLSQCTREDLLGISAMVEGKETRVPSGTARTVRDANAVLVLTNMAQASESVQSDLFLCLASATFGGLPYGNKPVVVISSKPAAKLIYGLFRLSVFCPVVRVDMPSAPAANTPDMGLA